MSERRVALLASTMSPTVDPARMLRDLDTLAGFGGRPDGGVDRVAGSAADLAARRWLVSGLRADGLCGEMDEVGNVRGRSRGARTPYVLAGSHTDTVPAGGRFDGAYGVIAAWEALRVLHETGHPAADVLRIIAYWDEEGAGATATGGVVGSSALCRDGEADGLLGFLELHVEQGPRMERADVDLAAVGGIVGIERWRVSVDGAANHAGTTPMAERADAGLAAARLAAELPDVVTDLDPHMVANVGAMAFSPGAPNVVPGAAEMTVEMRAESEMSLARARAALGSLTVTPSLVGNCTTSVRQLSRVPVTDFDGDLLHAAERACATQAAAGRLGERLTSFAGHDAGVLSRHAPAAMIFVPSVGGVSHAPHEYTAPEQLVLGAQALLDTVVDLHRRHGR